MTHKFLFIGIACLALLCLFANVSNAGSLVVAPNPPFRSNTIIDVGQIAVINTIVSGGLVGYTSNWLWSAPNAIGGSGSAKTGNTIPITTINTVAGNNIALIFQPITSNQVDLTTETNVISNVLLTSVVSFNALGTWTFRTVIVDSNGIGTNTIKTSATGTITVDPALTISSFTALNTLLVNGQYINLQLNWAGGTGLYTYNVFNITTGSPTTVGIPHTSPNSCNGIVPSHAFHSASCYFQVSGSVAEGTTFTYNLVVTDQTSPTNNIVNSIPFSIVVNPDFSTPTITVSNSLLDSGQYQLITPSTVVGGTYPYNVIYYNVTSSQIQQQTGNSWSTTTSYPGLWFGGAEGGCVGYINYIYCIAGSGSILDAVYSSPILSSNNLGIWQETNSYPVAVNDGTTCTTYSNNIYCIAGDDGDPTDYNSVYQAPIFSGGVVGSWTAQTNYPANMDSVACITNSNNIYCVGGVFLDTAFDYNAVYYAPILSSGMLGSWQTPANSYPNNVDTTECLTYSNNIYCLGGLFDSTSLEYNAIYNATIFGNGDISTWSSQNSYPANSAGLSCTTSSNDIYCISGLNNQNTYFAPIFNTNSIGTWTSSISYPGGGTPIGSCANIGNNFYCEGDYPNNYGTYFAPLTANGFGGIINSYQFPVNSIINNNGFQFNEIIKDSSTTQYTANSITPVSSNGNSFTVNAYPSIPNFTASITPTVYTGETDIFKADWHTNRLIPIIDGTASNVETSSALSLSNVLTTGETNDVIIVLISTPQLTTAGTVTVSDSAAAINWQSSPIINVQSSASGSVRVFYGNVVGTLSSDIIEASFSGATNAAMQVFGVSGANTITPIDGSPLSGYKNLNSRGDTSTAFSTSDANDIIFFVAGDNGGASSPIAGLIGGAQSSLTITHPRTAQPWDFAEYLQVPSPQSSITASMTWTLSTQDGWGVFAIQPGTQTVTPVAPIGGGTSPFTYNFNIFNSINYNIVGNMLITNSFVSNTFWWIAGSPGNTVEANIVVTDSATSNVIFNSANSAPIQILQYIAPNTPTLTISNTAIDQGQGILFTANIVSNQGALPLSYAFNVYATNIATSTVVLLANQLFTNVGSTTDTWFWQPTGDLAVGNTLFFANVVITDSYSPYATVNSVESPFGYNSALVANPPTESNTIVYTGWVSLLTAQESGGTLPYQALQWYTNYGSSADCSGTNGNAINHATSGTYLALPITTNSYVYSIEDSATPQVTVCSSANTVTFQAPYLNAIVSFYLFPESGYSGATRFVNASISPSSLSAVLWLNGYPFVDFTGETQQTFAAAGTYNFSIVFNGNTVYLSNSITNTFTLQDQGSCGPGGCGGGGGGGIGGSGGGIIGNSSAKNSTSSSSTTTYTTSTIASNSIQNKIANDIISKVETILHPVTSEISMPAPNSTDIGVQIEQIADSTIYGIPIWLIGIFLAAIIILIIVYALLR